MPERKNFLHDSTDVAVLLPDIGAGKRTFWHALEPELQKQKLDGRPVRVQVFEPKDGNMLTCASWDLMKKAYLRAGRPGKFQEWVGKRRKREKNSFIESGLLWAANREVKKHFGDAKVPVVSFHGLFGQHIPRFLIDADVVPEPKGITYKTSVLVPIAESADSIQSVSDHQEIHTIGFMVPEALQDQSRPQRIIDIFQKGDLDPEDPLRVSFLMTGQGAHMEDLGNILSDPLVQYWVKTGQMKLDVFLWDHGIKAQKVFATADALELRPLLQSVYTPDIEYGVQVYSSNDAMHAVDASIAMVEKSHIFVTPPAERTPFAATTYPIFLDPVKGNGKMEGNLAWLLRNGVAGSSLADTSLSCVVTSLFENGGQVVNEHFVKANEVFEQGKLLNGAQKAADLIKTSYAKTGY